MANAQWTVTFEVHLPSDTGGIGDTFRKTIYLASPDLKNTIEAKRRAATTARERLNRWLDRSYGSINRVRNRLQVCLVSGSTMCIG